ncbi:MAG: thiamine phosphate synthase YjbQ, UPF0047 family [Chloroflexi bacterium]|jgi:secondary thiamine-phosphate synthase enzyme|nr:MAG: thiamine phosphate synthase YjbQ, UPF0047 family [Chloroflexota bacterium]
MLAVTNQLIVETNKPFEFIDITSQVVDFVTGSTITNGCVVIYSKHTTGAIKVNENEPLLIEDMETFLQKLAPKESRYRHNDFKTRTVNMTEDECPNGHAHCQHLIMSTSETIPIIDGNLQFGKWQSVFFVELDGPRSREVILQVIGQ